MSKNVFIGIVVAVLVVVGGFLLFSSSDSTNSENSSAASDTSFQEIGAIPDDLDGAIAKAMERQGEEGVYIIDVRTTEEWETEHVKDATFWSLEEKIVYGELPPLEKDSEIYIYCRTGNRATQAIKIMQGEGFTNMTNIRGLTDWVAAGGAVETGL